MHFARLGIGRQGNGYRLVVGSALVAPGTGVASFGMCHFFLVIKLCGCRVVALAGLEIVPVQLSNRTTLLPGLIVAQFPQRGPARVYIGPVVRVIVSRTGAVNQLTIRLVVVRILFKPETGMKPFHR